ncbi:hypothetical protein [Streptomyces indicus]|uniref:Sigma-like protein n=1 Tax=Streptomyces indicus TaxID=417292 RepID=A0A1G9HKQ7_9ACTN|nr:hypothetical protein [Streptomyces indicus]SDL13465.1 hypothetical protein SAMN05421806_11953 [Streptomyces indicus]
MSDETKNEPGIVKPLDEHATSEPAKPLDEHATSEPAKPQDEHATGEEV